MTRDPARHEPLRFFDALSARFRLRLGDPSSLEALVAETRTRLTSVDDMQVFGARAQAMFGYVAGSLRGCARITEIDAGRAYAANRSATRPDYEIVPTDGNPFFVEVKNCHADPVKGSFRIRRRDVLALQKYADVTGHQLRLAVYWSRPGLWTLLAPERLSLDCTTDKLMIRFVDALTSNEMYRLDDELIATVPPIEVRLHPAGEHAQAVKDGVARFTVGDSDIYVGGLRVEAPEPRALAWYLALFGRWSMAKPRGHVEGDQIAYGELTFEPNDSDGAICAEGDEHPSCYGVGLRSEMISRQFLFLTSTLDGKPVRISPEVEELDGLAPPAMTANQPGGFPLWILRIRPKHSPETGGEGM